MRTTTKKTTARGRTDHVKIRILHPGSKSREVSETLACKNLVFLSFGPCPAANAQVCAKSAEGLPPGPLLEAWRREVFGKPMFWNSARAFH